MTPLLFLFLFGALAFIIVALKAITIVPQARAAIVERFGKYRTTLEPGLQFINPIFDKVAYKLDMREQIVSFPPQPVITEDNLVVSIDTVIYFQVADPLAATYEVSNYIQAIEQLTMATLRNIIGKMTLETALTSRDTINSGLRGELDSATGKWGIRVNRVELKGIDPPHSIIDAMEKQMRAERDKRATILTAEADRQSAILTAEGNKQAAILNAEAAKTSAILSAEAVRESQILEAEGARQAEILKAQGQSQAILAVSQAIHDGNPDQKLLAFKYLETLPLIAQGPNASTWVVPAELTKFLNGVTGGVGGVDPKAVIPADGGGVADEHRLDLKKLGEDYLARAMAEMEVAHEAVVLDVTKPVDVVVPTVRDERLSSLPSLRDGLLPATPERVQVDPLSDPLPAYEEPATPEVQLPPSVGDSRLSDEDR